MAFAWRAHAPIEVSRAVARAVPHGVGACVRGREWARDEGLAEALPTISACTSD